MLSTTLLSLAPYFLSLLSSSTSYDLVRDYSGTTFFDRWDFYGSWDNLTLGELARILIILISSSSISLLFLIGDVWWLDRASAFRENLAYVNEHNRVIIKVDNVTNVPFNEKRNSVIVTWAHYLGPIYFTAIKKKTISDSNHLTRLVRARQPLDYRLDTSPLRMFGTSMLPLILSIKRR
jgi:hypothetical protein